MPEEFLFDLFEPFWEEFGKQLRHQICLMRLLLLHHVFKSDQDRHWNLIRVHLADFLDHVLVKLFHDLGFELLASDHQISKRVKALDYEVVASNTRQFGQDRQYDVSQLKVIVNQKLRMLHKCLNVLFDRESVLCL